MATPTDALQHSHFRFVYDNDCFSVILGFLPNEYRFIFALVCTTFHDVLKQICPSIKIRSDYDRQGHTFHTLAYRCEIETRFHTSNQVVVSTKHMLQYFIEHTGFFKEKFGYDVNDGLYTTGLHIVLLAIRNGGSVEVVTYALSILHRSGFLLFTKDKNLLYVQAIARGDIDIVKLLDAYAEIPGITNFISASNSTDFTAEAAKHGKLSVLIFLRDRGCEWNEKTCQQAARHGHLDILKHAVLNGCDFSISTMKHAAKGGHSEILKWIYKYHMTSGVSAEVLKLFISACENSILAFAQLGDMDMLKYVYGLFCTAEIEFMHVSDEEWNSDFPIHRFTLESAAMSGNLNLVKYLHEELHVGWDGYLTNSAAKNGHLDILRYAVQNGCKVWSGDILETAIDGGHFDVLVWLLANEHGHWTSDCTMSATLRGDMRILELAFNNGVEFFTYESLDAAVKSENLEVVTWLISKGVEMRESTFKYAVLTGYLPMIKHLKKCGCPVCMEPLVRGLIHAPYHSTAEKWMIEWLKQLGYASYVERE
jgi:hypothetical protein